MKCNVMNTQGSILFHHFKDNNSNVKRIYVCNKRTCQTLSAITCDKILDKCHHFCIGPQFHSECIQDCIHCNYNFPEHRKKCTCPICFQLSASSPTVQLEICNHFVHYFCLKRFLHEECKQLKSGARYDRIYASQFSIILFLQQQ